MQIIANLHKNINFNLYPDFTIILDAEKDNVDKIIARINNRHAKDINKIDTMPVESHKKAIHGFHNYKDFYNAPACLIPTKLSFYEIHHSIIKQLNSFFQLQLQALSSESINKILKLQN